MNIFDLDVEEINKKMKEILSQTTPEKVLNDLFKCGYKRIEIDTIKSEVEKVNYKIEENFKVNDKYLFFLDLHTKSTSYKNTKEALVA